MFYNGFTPDYTGLLIKREQAAVVRRGSSVWGFAAALGNIAITVIMIAVLSFSETYRWDLSSNMASLILQIVLSTLMMTLPFIIGAASQGLRLKELISFKRVRLSLFLPLIMVGIGGAMISNNMTNSFVSILQSFGFNPNSGSLPVSDDMTEILVFTFTIAVLPAIVEEFAYRGVVLGALRRYGDGFAVIASGLLFGLMHSNFVQIPFAVALGCVFGYINVLCDSIWPSVAVHFLNNFLSCLQEIITIKFGETNGIIAIAISISLALLLGIIGFIWLCRKYKHPFAPIHEKSPIPTKVALSGFLASPGMITSYIIFGGTALVEMLPYSAGI